MSRPQKHLLIIYLPITLFFGATFFLLHQALAMLGLAPDSMLMYTPVILGAAVMIYLFYFRHKVREVKYQGAGPVTVATVYFMAMFTIPWVGLNWAASTADHVQELDSVEGERTGTNGNEWE